MRNLPDRTRSDLTTRLGESTEAMVELASDVSRRTDAKTIQRLRKRFGIELADLVLASASLQDKARKKLGDGTWWVTRKSLQQATPWQVAHVKSSWFEDRMVYDLCCGIGGDTMALARRGPVVAVDADPILVEMVSANLANLSSPPNASGRCADVTKMNLPPGVAIHMDPDRRTGSHRTSEPEHYRPSWTEVESILAKSECAVVKLAPAAPIATAKTLATHSCWISLARSVRERSMLWGEAIDQAGLEPGRKSAWIISSDANVTKFIPRDECSGGDSQAGIALRPAEILVDPDPAIRAAGLTENFAFAHELQCLGNASGFLTGTAMTDAAAVDSMAVWGKVIWNGPCDDRRLRRELRHRNVYPMTIKVRGTDHDPATLVNRYRSCGENPITLWIGRAGSRVYAAMTEI